MAMTYEQTKMKIVEGGVKLFKDHGLKFTMDELANEIKMSKKTIYVMFRDKEALLYYMADYFFDDVQKEEEKILADDSLGTVEKFRGILGALPDIYSNYDFTKVFRFKDKYKRVYDHVSERLESGWDITFQVLDQGIKEGVFRDINHTVFKMAYSSSVERFLTSPELSENKISYADALNELVDIMVFGVKE